MLRGGIVRPPLDPDWSVPGIPLAAGEMYACMAETVLMALDGATSNGSYGALSADRVRETRAMACRHGFDVIQAATRASY